MGRRLRRPPPLEPRDGHVSARAAMAELRVLENRIGHLWDRCAALRAETHGTESGSEPHGGPGSESRA